MNADKNKRASECCQKSEALFSSAWICVHLRPAVQNFRVIYMILPQDTLAVRLSRRAVTPALQRSTTTATIIAQPMTIHS